ncbi:MAG: NAD+ synthase [Pseudomonadota bacterium]|nr:NAD+ synthase [Pseudomonadota bacterium]
MKVALAQINPTVGNILGNYNKIIFHIHKYSNKADLIIFPELSLSGYPPEDLVYKQSFLLELEKYINKIGLYIRKKKIAVIIGSPIRKNGNTYNSAIFMYRNEVTYVFKNKLPNYGVFDEKRIFQKGKKNNVIKFKHYSIGLLICEDIWYGDLPTYFKKKGANILISINASPFENNKLKNRLEICKKIAKKNKLSIIYVNQVGGQDELVFDGNSFFMNLSGEVVNKCSSWKEETRIIDLKEKKNDKLNKTIKYCEKNEFNTWSGLTLGLKDYFYKNSFKKIVLGLSGGIDSAVSAAIAVDAVGSKNVIGVLMPSRYSSKESIIDAEKSAKLLKIDSKIVHIKDIHKAYILNLKKHFLNDIKSLTDENLQSRIRGSVLMAFSNNFSYLLISTGNKSEMSVGYSTIYGDMNGGFNVLKDVYKTDLYNLAKWRNNHKSSQLKGPKGIVIPKNSILKSPSAELRPNQKDTDSLPPYEILDEILYCLIEEELSVKEIVKRGFKTALVKKISALVFKSEYKRRQAPPGVKLSSKAFGKERRYPITNKFKN